MTVKICSIFAGNSIYFV